VLGSSPVQNRPHIIHPLLKGGGAHGPIREPGSALVEENQAPDGVEALDEPNERRVLPLQVEVAHEALDEKDVAFALADNLVRDVDAIVLHIADRRPLGHPRRLPSPGANVARGQAGIHRARGWPRLRRPPAAPGPSPQASVASVRQAASSLRA
jgi:hypothetical protein